MTSVNSQNILMQRSGDFILMEDRRPVILRYKGTEVRYYKYSRSPMYTFRLDKYNRVVSGVTHSKTGDTKLDVREDAEQISQLRYGCKYRKLMVVMM